MTQRHLHFVTGKLAASSLEGVVRELSSAEGFDYSIQVMPITVAALLTPRWIAPRLELPPQTTEVWLPGYCNTDLTPIREVINVPVVVGPRELRALPEHFGRPRNQHYGAYSIAIIAEINHAPRLEFDQILQTAKHYRNAGADLIDVGCDPGESWARVGDCVRALRDEGYRVSIDSMRPEEIAQATKAGAELVLSVNSSNREAATDWGCEVVVIPDNPHKCAGLDSTVDYLAARSVPMRIDPILEPIGCGFADSLARYMDCRRRYPEVEMMMGVGNLTELTDVDSAGVNVLLVGFCQELGIRSVLTTEVINWARTSVAECDMARRLAKFAVDANCPPKHVDNRLLMLRDERLYPQGSESLRELSERLKDNNYRIFAEDGQLRILAAGIDLSSTNAFDLFLQLMARKPTNMDSSHAFYLGYELAKATTAITLGKQYYQDQALNWGMLTRPEDHQRRPGRPEL